MRTILDLSSRASHFLHSHRNILLDFRFLEQLREIHCCEIGHKVFLASLFHSGDARPILPFHAHVCDMKLEELLDRNGDLRPILLIESSHPVAELLFGGLLVGRIYVLDCRFSDHLGCIREAIFRWEARDMCPFRMCASSFVRLRSFAPTRPRGLTGDQFALVLRRRGRSRLAAFCCAQFA